MAIMCIIVILALITGIYLLYFGFTDKDPFMVILGLILLIFYIFVVYILLSTDTNEEIPTALDVYRGKTTLQITYQNNIPIDSIVVFKK